MKRETITLMLNGVADRFISEAAVFCPDVTQESPERITGMKKKRIITLALVAALMLSFSIVAYAAYHSVSTPQAAEKAARQQLAEWRALGLLNQEVDFEGNADDIVEIEERDGGAAWYGRLFPHSFSVHWYFGERKYGCHVNIDTLDGKIKSASFFALPDEDAVPTGEITLTYGTVEETKTYYYYDNFDDLLPADQTVDGFCTALAQYWGYEGYRLADRGDPVYTEAYAARFADVDGSTRLVDVPWDAKARIFLAIYFYGDPEQAPVYLDLLNYPGYVGFDVGISHPVG